jgi:hypothetical protein
MALAVEHHDAVVLVFTTPGTEGCRIDQVQLAMT